MRFVLVILSLVLALAPAHAETIAMLPLDGEKRLEIYGQPVAAEIARALKAAGLDVVVVGAKMDVPDGAQLIVDGTIKEGKKKAITLSIRIRDPRDGTVLETLPAPTTSLDKIDQAAAELSARVVPSVKTQLDTIAKAKAAEPKPNGEPKPPTPPKPPTQVRQSFPALLSSIIAPQHQRGLADAFQVELPLWAAEHRREARAVPAEQLSAKDAVKTVNDQRAELALSLEVLSYSADKGNPAMARARVRVRISSNTEVKFERVVRTDTVVGDKDGTPDELARRTAREVLAITHAQLRRAIATWR